MSTKSLIALMEKTNIADDLDEKILAAIASDVMARANEDLDSMKDWIDCVDEGLKLCKPEFRPKSDPWDGAANFKSTLLAEASNNFGNRAAVEIMRDMKLVKVEIIGLETTQNVIDKNSGDLQELQEKLAGITEQVTQLQQQGGELEPEVQKQLDTINAEMQKRQGVIQEKKTAIKEKIQRADRVTELMNWQINSNMKEWRKDQKRLMYSLPNVGSIFKKTYYDSSKGRCVSDIINYPNFIINQATVSLEECRSFTHLMSISKNKAVERMKSGVWRDCELFLEDGNGDEMSNEANGVESAIDNDDCFYEQYCWIDLDDDGYEEPYIVTLHKASESIVRIVARYDYEGLIVKYKDMKPMPLLDAQKARAASILKEAKDYSIEPELPDAMDLKGFKVIRIEPKAILTKYGFVPSPDGRFLDEGFFHLIGSLTMGVNKVTNNLLNSGTLANNQSGLIAKSGGSRQRKGDFKFKMGQIMQSDFSPSDLQSSIYMLQFKEPSATLFNLNESMKASAATFSMAIDEGGIQANTAPTTALAMVQESLMPHTAHTGLIIDSMSEEFAILFSLNSDYLDDDEYRKIVGDDEAVFKDDFATDGLSIICGANPEMSSRMQRMMLAESEIGQLPLVMQAGGNPIAILKNYYKAIGSQHIQEYFPNEAEMSPQDRQQMQAMKSSQDQANQLQKENLRIQDLQVQLLARAEDRKDAELQLNKPKTLAEIDKVQHEATKVQAETILSLEKAETEQVKNQIGIYTTRSNELTKAEQALSVDPMLDDGSSETKQPEPVNE